MPNRLYRNQYRPTTTRLKHWNYSSEGTYFITICTRNRYCWLGDIENDVTELSEIGMIIQSEWYRTFALRPDMNLQMGEFVIMPNHFHAIIGIGKNQYNEQGNCLTKQNADAKHLDAKHCVSTNCFQPQRKNLASIIRGFKSSVTIYARKINSEFGWQPRFHDHIIRTSAELGQIEFYIKNNPKSWKEDCFS